MTRFLLFFLAPGEKLPEGASHLSLSTEGIGWGMALVLFVVLVGAVTWSYQKYAEKISTLARAGLIVLRGILIASLILLLVHPVLLVALEDNIRRPLLVLLDLSESMTLKDHRTTPDDQVRVAIARGTVDPAGGLRQSPGSVGQEEDLSRAELLEALAGNTRLNLWPQLRAKADLLFYGFGRRVTNLGELGPTSGGKLTASQAASFFHGLRDDENLTALGDGLREVLDEQRGQALAGIVLITDGANNTGSPPQEAAELARQDGAPLYIYGVGITSPQDIVVTELKSPPVCNVNETAVVTAHIRAQNLIGRKATIQLMANGKKVDEQTIEIRADGDQEFNLSYTPDTLGEADLEAYVPPLEEETNKNNNSASTKMRVVDTKLNVLIVEGQPNWDFQYLLAMLQRDRRIKVKCFLFNGDPGLTDDPNSPFLAQLPEDKQTLFTEDIIILGDVDPAMLGDARMNLLKDWVGNYGGGLVFLAGSRFDPSAYGATSLKALLPVETVAGVAVGDYPDPVKLHLTPAGEASALLNLSKDSAENRSLWDSFPGATWTAPVGSPHPGAEVLLVDPTPGRANPAGPMPVIADQTYGLGKTLYVGFDETYRWRSHVGEKYYTRIWGQMLQAVGSQRTLGTSVLTQLKTDRVHYFTGDKVMISAHLFKSGFEPVVDPDVPGTLVVNANAAPGQPKPAASSSEVHLQPDPDHPGFYAAQVTARTAGDYSFSVTRDPSLVLKFDAADPRVELADTAMNESLLKAMATASGGAFFREENLHELPARINSAASKSATVKKVPLAFSPLLLAIMILAACVEWFWRRKLELK
jgi:hypothetical protein